MDEAQWRCEALYIIGYALGTLSSLKNEVPAEPGEKISTAMKTIDERLELLRK